MRPFASGTQECPDERRDLHWNLPGGKQTAADPLKDILHCVHGLNIVRP